MSLVVILLYLLSVFVIWQFVGYPLLMAIIAIKDSRHGIVSKTIKVKYFAER